MNAPNKCPKCGWPAWPKHKRHIRTEYQCGSEYYEGVTYEGAVVCLRRQRDALAARVKELEEELEGHAWEINPAMYEGAIEGHVAKIAKLEAKVKELEAYTERLTISGDLLAAVKIRNGRSHEQWHAAKETKP